MFVLLFCLAARAQFLVSDIAALPGFSVPGSVVSIPSGTYTNCGHIGLNFTTSPLTVEGGGNVVIDCQGASLATAMTFYTIGGHWTIRGITITGAGTGGGYFSPGPAAMYVKGGTVVIEDMAFQDNSAYFGGAIAVMPTVAKDASLVVSNCTFTSNEGDIGGAIYFRGLNLDVFDSSFVLGVSSDDSGGAINFEGKNITVRGSTFTGNSAVDYAGGAMYAYGRLLVDNCTFTGNYCHDQGGAIYALSGPMTIMNSYFAYNYCEGTGGAVRCHYYASIAITSTTFFRNGANYQGGAVALDSYVAGSHALISGCNITSNDAEVFYDATGGGVSVSGSNVDVVDTVFVNNRADFGGGLFGQIDDDFVSFTIRGCVFDGNAVSNSTDEDTGAAAVYAPCGVQISNTTITRHSLPQDYLSVVQVNDDSNDHVCRYRPISNFNNVSFAGNAGIGVLSFYGRLVFNATSMTSHAGTGVSSKNANVSVADCVFSGCVAEDNSGGALRLVDTAAEIFRSSFSNNEALNGGDVSISGSSLVVYDSTFVGSTAYDGGSIDVRSAIFNATRCSFTLLSARNTGGAIRLVYATASVSASQWTSCSTDFSGAAFYSQSSALIVDTCRFTGNNGHIVAGGIFAFASMLHVRNTHFVSNLGFSGGAVSAIESFIDVDTCSFVGNGPGLIGGAISLQTCWVNIRDSTFSRNTATNGGALSVQQDSLCIVDNCTFTFNRGGAGGGAIYAQKGILILQSSHLDNNVATVEGGAISSITGSNITIFNTNMVGNSAIQGGAVAASQSSYSLNNSVITANVVAMEGGGIYATKLSSFTLQSTLIWNNTAGIAGSAAFASGAGGVYLDGSTLSAIGSAVCQNWVRPSTGIPPNVLCERDAVVVGLPGGCLGTGVCGQGTAPCSLSSPAAACVAGSCAASWGGPFCGVCDAGWGATASGTTAFQCEQCPVGSASASTGGVQPCSKCPPGTSSSLLGAVTCTPCPAGTFADTTAYRTDCTACLPMTYSGAGAATCSACPTGAVCNGASVVSASNYYSFYAADGLKFGKCPTDYCTPGNNTCTADSHRAGPLCGRCEDGYQLVSGRCVSCKGVNGGAVFGIIALNMAVTAYTIYFVEPEAAIFKILSFFAQTMQIIVSGSLSLPTALHRFWTLFNLAAAGDCLAPMSYYGQFYIGLVSPLFPFVCLACFLVFERTIGRVCWRSCSCSRTPRLQKIGNFIVSKSNRLDQRARYVQGCWSMLLYTYMPCVAWVLAIIPCRPVYPDSLEQWLEADTSIVCKDATGAFDSVYLPHRIVGYILLVLYVYGLPVFILAIVVRLSLQRRLDSKEVFASYGILYASNSSRAIWWEAAMQFRKSLVATIVALAATAELQLSSLAVFLVMLFFFHVVIRPHKSARDNVLETITLAGLAGVAAMLASSWFRSLDVSGAPTVGFLAVFISLLIPLLASIIWCIMTAREELKLRKEKKKKAMEADYNSETFNLEDVNTFVVPDT